MSTPFMKIFAVAFLMLAVAGCRTATIYNVKDASLNAPQAATSAQIEQAIKRAGASLGWQMRQVAPGHIVATLPIRTHVAVADVYYTNKDFSIDYKDSTNLRYDKADDTIHVNYNSWIKNLQNAIVAQVGTI